LKKSEEMVEEDFISMLFILEPLSIMQSISFPVLSLQKYNGGLIALFK
jgi:hypothetical protein